MPYSCTATRAWRIESAPAASIATSRSRQVFGSGAVTQAGTCSSRSTASGFGPRTATLVRRSASMNASRAPQTLSATSSQARVPTPVSRMTESNPPSISALAALAASVFDSSGTSRIDGAESGTPPYDVTIDAISRARRLSRIRTRAPLNEGVEATRSQDNLSRNTTTTARRRSPRRTRRFLFLLRIGHYGRRGYRRVVVVSFGDSPVLIASQIRFLAVLRDVETGHLVLVGRAQRDHQADDLQQDEADDAAVDDGGQHRRALRDHLSRIAEQQSVLHAVEALLREDSGEQRTHRAAETMRRHDVERVVE